MELGDQSDSIVDERVELMTSLSGHGAPVRRTSYFLKPCATFVDESVFDLSSLLQSSASTSEHGTSPPKVNFRGWRQPSRNWKSWIERLHTTYQSAWKEAGIYESIMNSKLTISRENELLFNLAEKWSPETNTFIFPWGEATIKLEDVMILGGFSVTGKSFICPNEICEFKEIEKKLCQAKTEAGRSKSRKASQSLWINMFVNDGNEIEHEAFLVLWLSRFVLPDSGSIKKFLFPIAVHLSKGIRIALAPAVLASIYRDLTKLKEKRTDSTKLIYGGNTSISSELHLWSPLQLLQLWGWERFRNLQAKPNWMNAKSPPFARWHGARGGRYENVRLVLDSAGESFQWRPYANAQICTQFSEKVYPENEKWVELGSDLDQDLHSFALCLRVSQLVGINCVENYFPHRVAMQFGFDQDLPAKVSFSSEISYSALKNNAKPFLDRKLYVPSRFSEARVTTLYLKWWKKSSSGSEDSTIDGSERRKILPRKKMLVKPVSAREFRDENNGIGMVEEENWKGKYADVPPGFTSKHGRTGAVGSSGMEDHPKYRKITSSGDIHRREPELLGGRNLFGKAQTSSSSTTEQNAGRETDNSMTNHGDVGQVSRDGEKREEESRCIPELPGAELEARICRVEEYLAAIEASNTKQ